MFRTLYQIYSLLTHKERMQAFWCLLAMLLMGIIEVIGVASIMPFMAVIADPDAIDHHEKLSWIYTRGHFTSHHQFLMFLGSMVLVIIVLGNALTIFTNWIVFKFTYAREYTLSRRLLAKYLNQPYVFFLNRNTTELSKNILTEVARVISHVFTPCMQMLAKIIAVGFILFLLLLVDPILALTVLVILGGAYALIYMGVRRELVRIGFRSVDDNRLKYKTVSEAFGGIKDLKLSGKENYFIRVFSYYASRFAKDNAASMVISQLPRYALETLAFGGVLIIVLYLLFMERNISNLIPLLALYAFASLRLMPSMQLIFSSVTSMRIGQEAMDLLVKDLEGSNADIQEIDHSAIAKLPFTNQIELRNVSFAYPKIDKNIVDKFSLKIAAKTTVGFVGVTGAGKTTLIDLVLGLLRPQIGEIFIDDIALDDHSLLRWQKMIGYVPQSIYLADDTIARNIAFGIAEDEIDYAAVERAARMANIHDFIAQELNDGYHTVVGDRGIRLSGGQKQRVGIARALYHDPEVLILDEATSALDTLTENAILDAIHSLTRQKTIIIIAHRITTLKECDVIYLLKNREIISSGSYSELLETCQDFKQMAKLA